MAVMSGGEALARSLAGEGVDVVFGIPGIQIYGIVAALRDEPGIRLISTRHEQATTYMADGYARASGRPGVALVVPGVGLYNSASGLTNAYSRSWPVLLIAGQIPRGAMGKGRGAVHEIENQSGAVSSVTKWQRQVSRPREVPEAVFEAFRQMRTGRPRPVRIEIPPEAGVEREEVRLRSPARISRIVPSPDDLREAAQVIARSRLPVIYAGGGVAQSDAEATNIPVVTSSGGKGTIPDDHPLSYGSCFSPRDERQEMNQLYDVMLSADVVIGIGTRFSLGNPAGEASTLVNINIDHTELTRHQPNTIPLHGDVGATIEALLPHLADEKAGNRPSPQVGKGHGRIERRVAAISADIAWLQERHGWPGLQAVGKVTATRQKDGDTSRKTRYYLLSQEWPPEWCNDIVRGHWGIENRLHWVLDVTCNEDQARNRKGHCAENLALLRKLALNLARLEPSKGSMRGKLKRAGWDDNFLINVLYQFTKIHMR